MPEFLAYAVGLGLVLGICGWLEIRYPSIAERIAIWIAGPYVEVHEDDQIGENSMRPRW